MDQMDYGAVLPPSLMVFLLGYELWTCHIWIVDIVHPKVGNGPSVLCPSGLSVDWLETALCFKQTKRRLQLSNMVTSQTNFGMLTLFKRETGSELNCGHFEVKSNMKSVPANIWQPHAQYWDFTFTFNSTFTLFLRLILQSCIQF